ncbi:MAG: SDR family oxidoreductase [Chloroflexi bacterium SZAS-1]|nr:SDR family oxidoreductase [Chloroflexi bacterium SZAS-1]
MNASMVGKVALVTGAGSGIGRAAARLFAQHGAAVAVADIDAAGGQATAEQITHDGGTSVFIRADVAHADDVQAMIAQVVAQFGRLDYAHNNAGIEGRVAPLLECDEAQWDRIIAVNLKGVWLCLQHELRQMLAQGGGAIVNTASVAGLVGTAGMAAYAASKHGVVGLTKTAAIEYARAGIRVNAVCPGFIHTPMVERYTANDAQANARLARAHAIRRLGTPEEVAEAVVWLCSDAAAFVTGHALAVDGGLVAM